jgi:hypothetical protein
MGGLLRKLRGAIGTAVASAVAWALGSCAVVGGLSFALVGWAPAWQFYVVVAQIAAALGFVSGGLFSFALSTRYARTPIEDLRVSRMALWGAVTGLAGGAVMLMTRGAIPADPQLLAMMTALFGGLGGTTAAGLVMLAKSAPTELESGSRGRSLDSGR